LPGLALPFLLQQDGVDTEIFEMAPRAGGLCAGWFRKGYRFDCLSWLAGISENDPACRLLYKLGALREGNGFYRPEVVFTEIDGCLYEIPMDLCCFREFLLELSPRDARKTDEICNDIEAMTRAWDSPGMPQITKGWLDGLNRWNKYRTIYKKYVGRTVRELSALYENSIAGKILTRLIPGEYSALQLFAVLSPRMAGNAGYPMEGAAGIVRGMVSKYVSLGGKINCGAKVDKIIINGEAASGIKARGDFFKADGVIAACDNP
jgi:phytoene dehydrogenase-like protein